MLSNSSLRHKQMLLLLTLLLLVTACSGTQEQATTPSSSSAQNEPLICRLASSSVGDEVEIQGQIRLFEETDDQGYFVELSDDNCRASLFIEQHVWETFDAEQRAAWRPGSTLLVTGQARSFQGEMIVDVRSFQIPSASNGAASNIEGSEGLDPTDLWWLRPQTYYIAEGPNVDLVPDLNITVLHDWGSLFFGRPDNPDPYWSNTAIEERWQEAHRQGMRVEAVISILDIWYVDIGPDHELYPSSGIDLDGRTIRYDDPPAFVGCTNQHGWQAYLRIKIMDAIDMGVDGIIIDDQEGTSRWVSGTPSGTAGSFNGPGGCFCDECEAGFREYLAQTYSPDELAAFGIDDIETFDYSDFLTDRGWTVESLGDESRKFEGWETPLPQITAPLYEDYYRFQEQEVIAFLEGLEQEMREYARQTYGKEIAWSVNLSAVNYGTHPFIPLFDRNVAGIFNFGYPPGGTESYQYRLGYALFGAPRIREVPRDPMLVAVVNEYQPHNLLLIKNAVAYASQGAWIESGYFVEEGVDEDEIQSSFHIDPERIVAYNTFYLDHAELFNFQTTTSLADVGVVYSSASLHYNLNGHLTSFYGLCEILTDLHVQYDPIPAGDGLALDDRLTLENLEDYGMLFLPETTALTSPQIQTLLDYVQAGGTLVALGQVGTLDEHGQPADRTELAALLEQPVSTYGEGSVYHLYTPIYRADGIVDEEIHDPAAAYFRYFIENNNPLVESYLNLIEEDPQPHIAESTAQAIRAEMDAIIHSRLPSQLVDDTFSENILAQVYFQDGESGRLILHLINLEYDLEDDSLQDQNDLPIVLNLPDGFTVHSVEVLSPDGEAEQEVPFSVEGGTVQFVLPWLHIWDVVVIE